MSIFRLDLVLLTTFWSISYIFAIVYALKYKEHAVPPFSISLNFSWEIVALFMYWEYVDIAWVSLDVFIVILLIKEFKENKDKKSIRYLFSFVIYGIICFCLFNKQFSDGSNGYIFLSFTMDLIMAINYIQEFPHRKTKKPLLLFVTVFRLLGDFTAFIIYRSLTIVMIEGILVFILNIVYVILVIISLKKIPPKKQPGHEWQSAKKKK